MTADRDSSTPAPAAGSATRTAACALLALVLVAGGAVLAWNLPDLLAGGGDPWNGFDVSNARVPRETLVRAAKREVLPPLLEPPLLPAAEADALRLGRSRFFVPGDRVVGVVAGDAACAFPVAVLRWHEVVHATVGGRDLVVTWSGLTDSPRVYARPGEAELAVSGLVSESNPLLYDRPTESLWTQLEGRAVAGPAAEAGRELEAVRCQLVHWWLWKERHPDTQVVGPDLARGKLYKRDPYGSYEGRDTIQFPVGHPPPAEGPLRAKDRVVAVTAGGERRVYPVARVAGRADLAGRWEAAHGAATVRFRVSRDPAGVAPDALWVTAEGAPDLEVVPAFWFAWHTRHPEDPVVE